MNKEIKITIKKDFRKLKEGEIYIFDNPVNIIVGDNGSGKSTILTLLRSYLLRKNLLKTESNYLKKEIREFEEVCDIEGLDQFDNYYEYDAEVDTGKLMDMDTMIEFDGIFTSKMSSGEGDVYQLNKLLTEVQKTKNNLILLDEMDKGLSLKQRLTYPTILKLAALKFDSFIIAISHGESLLNEFDSVLSMTSKKWVKSNEYYMSFNLFKLEAIKFIRSLSKEVYEKHESKIDQIIALKSKQDILKLLNPFLIETKEEKGHDDFLDLLENFYIKQEIL